MVEEFNKDRQARQIIRLGPKKVFFPRGLADKVLNLSADKALELRFPLLPVQFQKSANPLDNTRKAYKHGLVLPLSQPKSQADAYATTESPLQIRARDFDSLSKVPEQKLYMMGFSFFPVQGNDKEKRIVPFVSIADGMRLYAWMRNNFPETKIEDYGDAKRALVEGGEFIVHIPSRTRKRFYRTKMSHVPVVDAPYKNAIVWSLDSNFQGGVEPEFATYTILFKNLRDVEGSDRKFMYPQQVAAMLAIADKAYHEDKNRVPWDMNPFPIMSQLAAGYDARLRNNVVVFDPNITTNNGLRKLHLYERSMMHGRLVGILKHDKTMFWDPGRDPAKLRDYNWGISRTGTDKV